MGVRTVQSIKKRQAQSKKILEESVEAYLVRRVKTLGGICVKQDASTYIGIPDRLVIVCGYTCMVELKRPKGGRMSGAQRMWKKFVDRAGGNWHHIKSYAEVDAFFEERIRDDKSSRRCI